MMGVGVFELGMLFSDDNSVFSGMESAFFDRWKCFFSISEMLL